MSTLNELVYGIISSVKPHLTDDDDLSFEKVAYDIRVKRSTFLRNEYNKNRSIDSAVTQDLGCVEVEKVDAAQCCGFDSGCKTVRTKLRIPNAIETHHGKLITRVGPTNKMLRPYNFVTYKHAQFAGNGEFNKNEIYAFLLDGYMYLKSNNENIYFLKYINIQGVFDNPEEIANFNTCDSELPCYDENSQYPLNEWMGDYISTTLKELYLKVDMRANTDLGNDAANKATDTQ